MADVDDVIGAGCGGFVVSMLICGAIAWSVCSTAREVFEKEAVEHGAAEFVIVDPKTGKTEFHWKESPSAVRREGA